MKKKTFATLIIMIIIALFSISYTFATNDTMDKMKNGVRNVIGGAENMVEGAGSAIGRTIRDGANTIGNGTRDAGNSTENTMGAITDNGRDDGYTATRTSSTTDAGNADNIARTYTWVVIGITAVGIIVLLWSYFRQNNKNDLYIDSNNK